MISQLAGKHADKCRFCWMCRHLCPVQLVTGKEMNTPRAKGLLLSMVGRGAEFDADTARAMYECLLCDACTNDCVTGYEPPLYIREARTEAIVNDLAPAEVTEVLDNIEKTGTIYGEKKPAFTASSGNDVLVFIGEVAALRAPGMVKAYLGLLDKAGVGYSVLEDEPESGTKLSDLMGYVEEVREQAEKCVAAINASKAKKVVVLNSYDAQIMIQKYPEWDLKLNAEVVNAVEFMAGLLADGKLSLKAKESEKACYHDDDRMARTFKEYKSGRELSKALGYEMTEMFNHFDLAKSCGSSVVKLYMPAVAKNIAAARWDDLKRTDAKVMIVSNPESYECLSDVVPEGYRLVDVYESLLEAAE